MKTLRDLSLLLGFILFATTACNTPQKKGEVVNDKLQDTIIANTNNEVAMKQIKHPGIYFKASGNEPFWNIAMEADRITFTSLIEGYEEIFTPLPEVIRAADANVKLYRVQTEKTSLRIEITQGDCADTMADKNYPYSVSVEIALTGASEPEVLRGCGAYQTDPRLNDIWVLEQMGEEKAAVEWFEAQLPQMEINASENTLMGFAGCNRMRGAIFWEPGLLRFTNIATTRMACKPGNKEADFIKSMESATSYRIENNRLWLSNPNGLLLVFKKVD